MKLSVVVPVYNVDSYVREFCDSLFSQGIPKGVEIIIVDDGSLDESIPIIIGCIDTYNVKAFVKVITQENAGLSAARNKGVYHAAGEYVTFIDPDDYVSDDYISTILRNLDDDLDVLTFNAKKITPNGIVSGTIEVASYESDQREKVLREVFNSGKWYAWCRVIRTEIIRNNLFPVGKRFEDLLTIPMIYIKSRNLRNVTDCLIFYRENPQGISKNPKLQDVEDVEGFLLSIKEKIHLTSKVDFEFYLLYISALKTLFYITNDFFGPCKSYLYINRYRFFNFVVFYKMYRRRLFNVSLNNIVFILFNEIFYIKRKIG